MENEENKYEQMYHLAEEHKNIKDYDRAKHYANQLREMNPSLWKGWEVTGRIHHESGEYEVAVKYYKKAIQLEYNTAFVHVNLGLAQQELGNYVEAFDSFCQSLSIDPTYELPLNKIYILINQERVVFTNADESISFFESINEKNHSDIVHQILSQLYSIKATLLYEVPQDTFSDETFYHDEDKFQGFLRTMDTAKGYFNNENFDKKIGAAYFNRAKQEVIKHEDNSGLLEEMQITRFIEFVDQAKSFDKENNQTYLAIIAAAKKKLKKKFDKSKLVFTILAVYYALMGVTPLGHRVLWVLIGVLAIYASYRPRYKLDRLKKLGEVTVPVFDHITKGYYAISHLHVIIQIIFWLIILSIPDVLYGLFHLQFLR